MSVHLLAADAYALSAGRIGAIAAALLGLLGIVFGGLALTSRRRGALVALTTGPIAILGGALVVLTADGGLGTGNGLGGGVVAMLLGLAGAVLGWRARSRYGVR